MELSDLFCQVLQVKSQDILNVVHLTSTEKRKKREIQRLQDNSWENFIKIGVLFKEKSEIDMLDLRTHHMRIFSAVKLIKIIHQNKMENEFL